MHLNHAKGAVRVATTASKDLNPRAQNKGDQHRKSTVKIHASSSVVWAALQRPVTEGAGDLRRVSVLRAGPNGNRARHSTCPFSPWASRSYENLGEHQADTGGYTPVNGAARRRDR